MPTRTCVVSGCVNSGQVHFSFPADCKVRANWICSLILCDNQFNNFVPGKEEVYAKITLFLMTSRTMEHS
jgi:hypothetical protein